MAGTIWKNCKQCLGQYNSGYSSTISCLIFSPAFIKASFLFFFSFNGFFQNHQQTKDFTIFNTNNHAAITTPTGSHVYLWCIAEDMPHPLCIINEVANTLVDPFVVIMYNQECLPRPQEVTCTCGVLRRTCHTHYA